MDDKTIELGIGLIEFFKSLAEMTNEQFVSYMNNNNYWGILNDEMLIDALAGSEVEEIVEIIGRYLSKDEQYKIISRYYSKFSDC